MILQFPFLPQPLLGPIPPPLAGQSIRWRPYVPLTVHGPLNSVHLSRTLVDSGADDTILPLGLAAALGVVFKTSPSGVRFGVRYRGQLYPTEYAEVELELIDDTGASLRWPAVVGFSTMPLRHPLLDQCGCFDVLDVKFLTGVEPRTIEFEAASNFLGTIAVAT